MKRIITLLTTLCCFQFLPGQENHLQFNTQDSAAFKIIEIDRMLDSLSLQNLNNHFYDSNRGSLNYDATIKSPDTSKFSDEEYRRLHDILGDYSDFKRKFLALDLKDNVPDLHLPKAKPGTPQLLDPDYLGSIGFLINSPISFFYYNLSKVEASRRRAYAFNKNYTTRRRVCDKYNNEKIQYWTGLKGDSLTKFILYCHFDDRYLLETSDYELIETVFIKLAEFRAMKDTCN
jgi:hypothetical protein